MGRKYIVKNFQINEENLTLQETIFHNANGYIGVRGSLEEGIPEGMDTMRGMYLNGFYDIAPMKQAEKLCNLVEDKETIVNVADTQSLDVFFEQERFSMLNGKVKNCERILDMEKGITQRNMDWESPEGKKARFSITRMTSFKETALFTIDYQFTSDNFTGKVTVESRHKGLVKNYFNPDDPRLAGESHVHLQKKDAYVKDGISYLVSETVRSGLQAASGVAHTIYINGQLQPGVNAEYQENEHSAVYRADLQIAPGDKVRIVKYCVLQDSIRTKECRKSVQNRMQEVLRKGIDYYYSEQSRYLEQFWLRSAMNIAGDDDMDSSVNFNMYELLQAAGTDGYSSIAAKGLSGEGYEGHYFWDTEMFMIPYFVLTNPKIAKKLLHYRYTTLPQAKKNAALLGHKKGALYPWRTITGKECSGYFPSGTAQYHIDGDIAYAIVLYYMSTGDWQYIKKEGLEMLLEICRLWMDVGHFRENSFRIHCVTGPDEYTCMVNNNYYTNAAAKYSLQWTLEFINRFREEKKEWEVFRTKMNTKENELSVMKDAVEKMYLPYDEKLGISPQDDSFLQKPVWNLDETAPEEFPLLLHYHPLHLYRYQVCKQADVVLAHFLFPEYQDRQTKEKSFLYYEKITTHDSSLSTCVFSMMASRLGMKEKAYEYLGDSAKMDLLNTHKNTKDGIHAANMGGCYMAVVYGFAGLDIKKNGVSLSPYLPGQWEKYSFRFCYQDRLIQVSVEKEKCSVQLLEGADICMEFYGENVILKKDKAVYKMVEE